MMSKRQLVALFLCSLIGWVIAQGTLALLPVYAVRLGADPSSIGNYLALAFGALTVGTIGAGWLSDRFQRRKAMLVVAGLINLPATWLMGQASDFWHLAVLTAIVWFFLGATFTTISILAGLFAGETERGKIFGLLALNTSLGALIGGAISGPIVDHWGYTAWFLVAARLLGAATADHAACAGQVVTEAPRRDGIALMRSPRSASCSTCSCWRT